MLVTVIAEKQPQKAAKKILQIVNISDVIELRVDYFEHINLAEIKALKNSVSIPFIFTLRKQSQGGLFEQDENQRLALIEQLAQLHPEFMDLEFDVPLEFAEKLKNQYPKIQFIRSYHDFVQTPPNLQAILDNLQNKAFSYYKIVTFAQSTLDCLRVLDFVKNQTEEMKLSSFCMGELGVPSRILGAITGNALHYACIDDQEQIAPGQLSLATLLDGYRFRSLNQNTKIYGLLGNPVDKSVGHIFHNQAFGLLNKNAVYVKLHLHAEELSDFFQLIKTLPFEGFSVTMPFKQDVIPYLDQVDDEAIHIKSVNTIVKKNGRLIGYNTDAKGALDAIEEKISVANKTIAILGAGGAARAIGYEAIQRKANVIFLNRTSQKARALAEEMNCLAYGFDEIITLDYDVLINATSVGMLGDTEALPCPEHFLKSNVVVMDTVYNPKHTALLKKAEKLNCTLIYGDEMFVNQAFGQLERWFEEGVEAVV